jgi:hypothetical protein
MDDRVRFETVNVGFIRQPELSEWQVHITSNFILNPEKGHVPNWLHRKMQELILGFKWRKKT